jgi:hypothetical protein
MVRPRCPEGPEVEICIGRRANRCVSVYRQPKSGRFRTELVRNRSDAARFGNLHFRLPSIHGDSHCEGVVTIHHVSALARLAHPVFAAEEADTDRLTDFPSGHSAARGFNAANDFMPGKVKQCLVLRNRVLSQLPGRSGFKSRNLILPALLPWPFG